MKFESNGGIAIETIQRPVEYVVSIDGSPDIVLTEQQASILVGRLRTALNYETLDRVEAE